MKRYHFLISILIMLTSLFACKKALETKGHSFLSPNTFYTNASDANAALNGAYANLFHRTCMAGLYGCYQTYRQTCST